MLSSCAVVFYVIVHDKLWAIIFVPQEINSI
jgi:hypothetical protein